MGYFQPGGAGTTIYVYDDADATGGHAAGSPHTWAEISAFRPADFISGGTLIPEYRGAVTVQIGDTGVGTATTSLTDATDSYVCFDNTRTLAFRASQQSSWFLTLGTKIGTGNKASGTNGGTLVLGAATTLRGTVKLYGGKIRQTTGALTWNPGITGSTGEAVNWMFQSTSSGTAPFVMGALAVNVDNLYNVDFSHTTANQMLSNFFVTSAERITFGGAAPLSFIQSGSPAVVLKDAAVFGTPTNADFRWASGAAIGWRLVRPTFSGGTRFSSVGAATIAVADATWVMRLCNVKVIDGTVGAAVSGIPVKLTDAVGTVVFDTVSDANGAISFGSGLTQNAVAVRDHYVTAGVSQERTRSPFLWEINTGSGRNFSYPTKRYYAKWPGEETQNYEDVGDNIYLLPAGGGPATWVERNADDLIP